MRIPPLAHSKKNCPDVNVLNYFNLAEAGVQNVTDDSLEKSQLQEAETVLPWMLCDFVLCPSLFRSCKVETWKAKTIGKKLPEPRE